MREGGKGDNRGWDGWMASPTQWTWVWVDSGVGDGQGGLECCSPWGHCGSWSCKELDTTQRLNWTDLKWTGMGKFNSDDHYIHYCQLASLRRSGAALIDNKRVWNAVLGCNLKKKKKMISVHFQGKPLNITVIQVYAPTSNAEGAEDEWFYENLQDLLELIPNKVVLFIIGNWNAKGGSQE